MFRPLMFIAAAALAPGTAFAHHSPAPYDMTQEVVFEGTVTALDWKNPHIMMTLETRSAAGDRVVQEIEMAAVSQVRAWGLPREVIAPGEQVVVRARPGRSGSRARALGLEVRTDDGRVYPLNLQAGFTVRTSVAAPAQGLSGQWVPTVESFNAFIVDFVQSPLPLTDAGRTAQAELLRRLMVPGAAASGICEPFPALNLMISPDMRAINVGEEVIVISYEVEGLDQQRVVRLDQADHPANLSPSLLGHSIGRFEGETLVIDTTAMEPHRIGIAAVLPSTSSTHLLERLSLTDDRLQLEYTFTIEDPVYLTRAVSQTLFWDYRPDLERSREPCDPDAARRALEE